VERPNDETMSSPPSVRLVALGGLGEIGMNCLAIEQGDEIMIVDCGVGFPTSDLGIDVYHPRFDFLAGRREAVRGVVLTHGHEDHIGALPYLLDALAPPSSGEPSRRAASLPIWGPPHALELARRRLHEHGFEPAEIDLRPTRVGARHDIGPFVVEPVRVTHSIADATALAIRTAAGIVLHTGDFKLDPSPPDGELTDEARLEELGREGVRLLLSDSTNVDSPGCAGSERDVGDALGEIVLRARQRVVIGMFASNVQRLRLIGEIAARAGRRICLLGRSVLNHTQAARDVGRLDWPSDLVVPPEVAAAMPRERVLIIASGTQAERAAALARLASGTHATLRLDPGDTVILSSRIIPGNDRPVFDLMASFLRLGVELTTRITDRRVHASGHAHRDEQLRMIEMTQPRSFVPVHGTLHHLVRHAALARDAGVEDVLVAEDGDIVEVRSEGPITRAGRAPVGRVATFGGDPLSDDVLRDRAMIGRVGVAFVSVVLDRRGDIAAAPQVVARGITEPPGAGVLRAASKAVARAVTESSERARASDPELMDVARLAARRAIEVHTGKRPIVTVALTRL
jgi:ribonuclease J